MIRSLCLFVTLILSFSCREKPTALDETLILAFYGSTGTELCPPDSVMALQPQRGALMLHTSNKALFTIRQSDTTHFYRGTYRLIDNHVTCTFNSAYSRVNTPDIKTLTRKKKKQEAFHPVKAWKVTLQKTGCAGYVYYSETEKGQTTILPHPRLVYKDAEPEQLKNFSSLISNIPALRDFRMDTTAASLNPALIPEQMIRQIEKHYAGRNEKSGIMKRTEDDAAVHLSFRFRKLPKGETPGPYLFVTIPKLRKDAMSGDMNGDERPDLVLQPVLSQGGGSRWKEFFLFLQDNEGYTFKTTASAFDLAQYRGNSHSGSFRAREIAHNAIVGESWCYLDEDAQCCPSVKVPTEVRLEKGSLRAKKAKTTGAAKP